MTELNFPKLDEPYATALVQAVDYVLKRFDKVLGIIAAGSILRGNGDENSDIDTFIIIDSDYRQRIQKFFNGVRFELFVNAPQFIPQYFDEEQNGGSASTAHMLATGHVVLNQSPLIDKFRQEAQEILHGKPVYDEQSLINQRYMLADRFENALDLRERDPMMGLVLIGAALSDMLVYQFQKQGKWIPRHKDILAILRNEEPQLANLVEQYYQQVGDECFDTACLIADYTIGVRGFFEWESDKDYLT